MAMENDRKEVLKSALLAVEEMQARLEAAEQAKHEPIAVVGLSCRFPGGANSPELYWEFLRQGADLVGPVPEGRWSEEQYQALDVDPENSIRNWQGGFLDHIDEFDPQFFGIIPREVITMDPQQRLVLEVAWEALERAGIPADQLSGSLTGVFIGVTTNDYATLTRGVDPADLDVYVATGSALNVIPGRLAYTLGLQGPSVAVDTACSSSLVAIHLACQSLRNGESDLAITGGVNALVSPEAFLVFNKWGMMAPDGRCKTFDADADGFVRAEGCGILVLKRLSDALADGDPVMAVIRGSAVNQDGRSTGLTAPNGLAQQQVIRRALADARVEPHEISYMEAHGTGTSLGDPIEVEAIGAVLGDGRDANNPLLMGSVKTNIGHAESAAGAAGVIKTILAMQHGELPPHLHLHERSPRIPWPDFPIVIPTELMPWTAPGDKRMAGVSAFGFSGTNAHIVLEQAPPVETVQNLVERSHHPITLSARNDDALREKAAQMADYLAAQPDVSLADVAFTTNTGRARLTNRLALTASNHEDAISMLEAFAEGENVTGLVSDVAGVERQRVVFLFTGQGSQYVGMGRQLYETQPTFRAAIDACDAILRQYMPDGLLPILFGEDTPDSLLHHTAYTQPALFAIEYALAQLWMSWGIQPHAVLGHSVGEFTAACIAGIFSLEDGLRLIAQRGRLMGALPTGGTMAAVMADEATVAGIIQPFGESVVVATLNGLENTVISGEEEAVTAAMEALSEQRIKTRRLNVSHAFHSPLMEPMLAEFERVLMSVKFNRPKLRIATNVTGTIAGEEMMRPDYWLNQARHAVRFSDDVQALYDAGYRLFLEVGPSATLSSMGQRVVGEGVWLSSLRENRNDWEVLLGTLGKLYVQGADIDWHGFDRDYHRRKVVLPTYPYQRQRYWMEKKSSPHAMTAPVSGGGHPLLGTRYELPGVSEADVWVNEVSLSRQAYLGDHQVQDRPIVPATAYIEMSVAAAVQRYAALPLALEGVQNLKPLYLNPGEVHQVQFVLRPDDDKATYEVYSRSNALPVDADWTRHVAGVIHALPESVVPTVLEQFDPETIIARCHEELTGTEFYQRLAEKGNQWGPAFQGIQQLWHGNGEALSMVRVPDIILDELESYQFHPAVSDTCGHVLTATISMDRSDDERGGAFVGAGVDSTRVYEPLKGDTFWCYARLRPNADQSNLLIGDVAVYDDQYRLVSETIGARLWYLDAQQIEAQRLEKWLYEVEWKPAKPVQATPQSAYPWLIFADGQGVGAALAAQLEQNGMQSILVYPSDTFEQMDEYQYGVRPGQIEDLTRLLDASINGTCAGAVFLWSLDGTQSDSLTLADLQHSQLLGSESVLSLVKALLSRSWETMPALWLATSGTQAVKPDEDVTVTQAALWGLGRSIALEQARLWGGLIDLDPHADVEVSATHLLQSFGRSDNEDQVAFRNNQRYVARLGRHMPNASHEFEVKPDAAYLITGGMGGLGLEIAHWLAEQGACHLVLIGRTPLPPRDEWDSVDPASRIGQRIKAIQRIEALGATVNIAAVDMGDTEALHSALADYAARGLPPVRGVVHAAGIMQYEMIQDHTVEAMRTIYAPKVAGSWALHRLFDDTSLDFFVMFSSISALLSSPLMCSYAAANSFMDTLAHYRRSRGLPALSVNWGTWREAGMVKAIDAPTRSMDESQSLSNAEGLETLHRLLQGNASQIAVMPIDWGQWQKQMGAMKAAPFLSQVLPAAPAVKRQADSVAAKPAKSRKSRIKQAAFSPGESIVAEIWQQVLGIDHFTVNDNFFDLGGNSLLAMEVISRIEDQTGLRLEPASVHVQTLSQLASRIEAVLPQTAPEANGTVHHALEINVSDTMGELLEQTNYEREVPIFFGPEDGYLFGMLYQPDGEIDGDLGVVICPPWGQEYIRAHRACHQLALRLSNMGIPALRFDYFGTGDSAGDELNYTVSRGLEDISMAVDELRARTGVENVVLVGLRLGATLATLAGMGQNHPTRVVLWDPIVNGSEYLDELVAWHHRNLRYYLSQVEGQSTNQPGLEVLGFSISPIMQDELRQVDLLRLDWSGLEDVMVVERESNESTQRLRTYLDDRSVIMNYQQIDGPQMWTENPDKALVPHQTLQAIIAWITEQ